MFDDGKPYKCELEYIESTRTQWVDTGYVPNGSETIVVSGAMMGTASTGGLFGSVGTSGADVWLAASASAATFAAQWGSTVRVTSKTFDTSNHVFENGLTTGLWCDGVKLADFGSNSQAYGKTIALFMRNSSTRALARISRFYIEGVIDLIPVLDNSGVACMYDRVSGKLFYNAGTGDFVAGPEIHAVEYIESSGTQGILTDIYTDANTAIKCKASGTSGSFFGVLPSSRSAWWTILPNDSGKLRYYYGGSSATDVATIDATIPHDYQCSNKVLVDGVEAISLSRTLSSANVPLSLFARTASSGTSFTSLLVGRMWYLQVIQSGATVRDFRAIRVGSGSTWEGAMLDTVERKVYRNAGTGAFTYGPDTN